MLWIKVLWMNGVKASVLGRTASNWNKKLPNTKDGKYHDLGGLEKPKRLSTMARAHDSLDGNIG